MPLSLIPQMKRMPRLIRHDSDVALIDCVAAKIHVELNFLLQHHHKLSGVVVSAEKFLAIVQSIDVLPAATNERFEERRPANVIENRFPIEGVAEIAKGFVVGVRWQLV